jgi:hypothetical protein
MTGFEIATLAFGGAEFLTGIFGGSKARKEQRAAQRAAWEEKIRSYEYGIEQTEMEIGQLQYVGQETRADIRREGEATMRGQRAAIGASGAAAGVGSPLMTMTQTAESIERDILRTTRLEEMEIEERRKGIEFMEQEIEELEKNLGGGSKEALKELAMKRITGRASPRSVNLNKQREKTTVTRSYGGTWRV